MIDDEYIVCLVGLSKRQLLKIPRSVKGIIRTDNQVDLAKIYQGAYVYVNPTYNDNYPTTNIEAAACGTRVITYKTGGSPESIKDRRNIIPCGDIQALLDAIKSPFDAGVRCEIDAKKCYRQYVSIIEQFWFVRHDWLESAKSIEL